ncbi:hypothetical protein D3C71_2040220 [compost metagenome]
MADSWTTLRGSETGAVWAKAAPAQASTAVAAISDVFSFMAKISFMSMRCLLAGIADHHLNRMPNSP